MKEYKPVKEGKVREIYDIGDALVLVATDRISCFDVILDNIVTDKGTVLTQMSKFWFEMTEDIMPNHMISTDVNDMPEFFRQDKFKGKAMMVKKLNMLPVECIVRGYITGSGWASYKENGTVCGIKLPEGLKESDKLPEPIYTPSTKAEIGDHDENISFEASIDYLEKRFPGNNLYPFMLDGSTLLQKTVIDEPFSLVFGNEATGLSAEFSRKGQPVRIEHTHNIDSLNLPTAVGIAIYEATKTRFGAGTAQK